MSTSADSLVRDGMAAFKSGNRDKARELLMKAVELDQYSEQGWLWLSAVVDSVEDQRTCLENVLAINPDNDRARSGLQTLIDQQPPPPTFTASAPPPPAPTASRPATRQAPAAPMEEWPAPGSKSSVDWGASGLETSSASSFRSVPEPTPDDYDDWLSNLNLPAATPSTPAPPPTTAAFTSPFNDDIEEDFGAEGPFSAPSVDDILSQLPPVASSSSAIVPRPETSIREAFRSTTRDSAPAPAAPARETPKPTREPARPAARPPARPAPPDDDDPFADLSGDIDINSTGLFTSLEDVDDAKLEEMNAEELFDYIPEEIKPTRLPGTVERYPALLIVALVLLALLDVGAVALLVYRLT